jgi:amino acid transporter
MKRDLGLLETISISMGAMVGSGIFILPGVAYLEVGGNAMVLSFVIGGLLTIPAALSAAEMGAAIPENGGSYVYVERGMGSMLGTIAGVGNWFMLNFKTALALIGGVPYLIFIIPSIQNIDLFGFEPIVVLAVLLCVIFTVVNMVSTDSAGSAQNYIVLLMLIALGLLFFGSVPSIEYTSVGSISSFELGGFISATGLVFISYAGVIKVTSVAEEIKNPEKNIPRAIILSLFITTVIYGLISYLIVSTVDINHLVNNVPLAQQGLDSSGEGAIIAIVAKETLGQIGGIMIVIAAILALASTANSGILSASRYPYSMSRDNLAPDVFKKINSRFGTPLISVLVTGILVILLVLFFPIGSAARFGGAFQIIIFMLVNLSVVGFRESNMDEYNPKYETPLYPYLQIFGIISGFVLLLKIGFMALVGAITITVMSLIYYYTYVRKKNKTEGAIKKGIRQTIENKSIQKTRELYNKIKNKHVMIVIREDTTSRCKEELLKIALYIGDFTNSKVSVVHYKKRYTKAFDENHPEVESNKNKPSWLDNFNNVEYTYIESQDIKKSIVNFATYNQIDFILHKYALSPKRRSTVRRDIEWIMENAPCETLLLKDSDIDSIDTISLVLTGKAQDPLKILMADTIAKTSKSRVDLIQVVKPDVPESRIESLEKYHKNIAKIMKSPVNPRIIKNEDKLEGVERFTNNSDLVITGIDISSSIKNRVTGGFGAEISSVTPSTCMLVYTEEGKNYDTLIQKLLIEYIFRGL